jgi:FixJ family two-component response regulator
VKDTDAFVVYVVDDDDSVRNSLSRLLRTSGFRVQAYGSAQDFLDHVTPSSEGCVLLDVTMPQMSGLRAQVKLREMGITLPVIAVSARETYQVRETTQALGARFFLHKPVDEQALLDAIAWVTQRPATAAQHTETNGR